MQINKTTAYWICQIAGWTAYCLNDPGIYSFRFGYSDGLLLNAATTIVLGISVTHVYRLVIKRLFWLDLPLSQLIPRIASCVLLMAIIIVKFSILVDLYTVPSIHKYYSPTSIVFFIINWGELLLVWSLIYHMFQYFEQYKKMANSHQ